MNDLRVFKNTEFGELGIMIIDGKEYFPATRCAKILGYTNPRKAIIDHCKEDRVTKRYDIDTIGRQQEMKYINEGNLYRLIVSSKLPSAEKFERWVFDEVLPSIRKTGSYSIIDNSYSNADMALLKIVKAGTAEERALAVSEYHEIVVKPLEDKIEEQKPLVEVAEKRISNKGCYTIADITKSLNLKRGYIARWAKIKILPR